MQDEDNDTIHDSSVHGALAPGIRIPQVPLFIGGVCTIACFDHATGKGLFAFVENMSSDKARGNPIFGDLSVTYYNYSGIACNYTLH
jgi:hypothetical protein